MAEVSVIIQNSEGQGNIQKCLEAVYSQDFKDFEVIVIDHSSMDDGPNIVTEKYPQAKLYIIESGKGFSYGINYGVSTVDSEYIALLDSTTYISEGWLSAALECMRSDKRIFSVSSKLVKAYNPFVIDSIGYSLTLSGNIKKIGHNKTDMKFSNKRKVFSSCREGALYRRSVLGIAGGFDDCFFSCLDDIDVSYRAFLCGYHTVFCPKAIALTDKENEAEKDFTAMLLPRNKIYMYYKNMPALQRAVNLPFISAGNKRQKKLFKKRGLENLYQAGVAEGRKNKKRLCINKRHKRSLKRHLLIEGSLVKNSFLNLFGR